MRSNIFAYFYCLLLLLSPLVTSYSLSGFMLKDLENQEEAAFAEDALKWNFYPSFLTGQRYSTCVNTFLLGGYCVLGLSQTSGGTMGSYFQRTYDGLPAHNSIRFQLNLWALDSFDFHQTNPTPKDGFKFSFDGYVIDGWHMHWDYFSPHICGNTIYKDLPNIYFTGVIPHNRLTLTIQVISALDENSCNESFGIKDLFLIFDQNASPASLTTPYLCGRNYKVRPFIGTTCDATLICAQNQYESGGICNPCDPLCASCSTSGASNCYACKDDPRVIWDGKKCVTCSTNCNTCSGSVTNCLTCPANRPYLVEWTGKCVLNCPFPLKTTVESTCKSDCLKTQYHAWDGTCRDDCPAPYTTVTEFDVIKICKYPCSPVEYLYWDGSCLHDCRSPFVITEDVGYPGQKRCTFPCTNELLPYLYWDGDCYATCDPPFMVRMQNNKRLCVKPCPLEQYYYWNGDCMDTCDGYLKIPPSTLGVKECSFPCDPDKKYLYWDGQCEDTCPYPLKTRVEKSRLYCDYPTDPAEVLYWDGTSSTTACTAPFVPKHDRLRDFCTYDACQYDYTYWENSCLGGCAFPLKVRIDKNRQYCDYPCTGLSEHLYWDGSCLDPCDPPLTPRFEMDKYFCDFSCDPSQFLYWDKSCSFVCPEPFIQRIEQGRKFCDFPCKGSLPYLYEDDTCRGSCSGAFSFKLKQDKPHCSFACPKGTFLYVDGKCLSSCEPPLMANKVDDLEMYCTPTCTTTTDYYYWNHTCSKDCLAPLKKQVINNKKWCIYPCLKNQFLNLDGSCSETCELPLAPRYEAGYKYCENPCSAGKYLALNGSCFDKCDKPFRQKPLNNGRKICLLPCDDVTDYYHHKTGICSQECRSSSVRVKTENGEYLVCLDIVIEETGSLLDLILEAPQDPNQYSLGALNHFLQYVRYIDIQMPPRLHNLAVSQGMNIITLKFGQPMPKSLREGITKRSMPEIFEERGLHSHFSVNFWPELMSWVIMAIITMIVHIFMGIAVMMNWTRFREILQSLIVILKWNTLLILVATSTGNIVFYTLVEIISLGGGHVSAISLLLSLLGLAVVGVLIAGIFYIVPSFDFYRRKLMIFKAEGDYRNFLINWVGVQVLFRGFRNYKDPNQYFYAIYIIRFILPMFIAAVLSSSPIAQTVLYLIVNLMILGYILIMRPIIRRVNFVQILVIEGFLLVVNLCLFLLVVLDSQVDVGDLRVSRLIGDIAIIGNGCINITMIIFLGIKVYQAAFGIYKYQRTLKQLVPAMWTQLLVFYAQQSGMGFEEMFVDLKTAELLSDAKYMLEDEKAIADLERTRLLKGRYRKVVPMPMTSLKNETKIKETHFRSDESFDGSSPLVRYKDKSLTNLLLKTAVSSSKVSSGANTPSSHLLKGDKPFTQIAEEQTLEDNLSTRRKRDSIPRERLRTIIMNEYEKKKSRFSEVSENAMTLKTKNLEDDSP